MRVDPSYQFLDTYEAAEAWLRRAFQAGETLAVDLETTGLDPHQGSILLACLATNAREAVLVPGHALPRAALVAYLKGPDRKIFHNGKFDMAWLMKHLNLDFEDFNLCEDTMIMQRMLNTGKNKKAGLSDLTQEFLGYPLEKGTRLEFVGHDGKTFTESQLKYAAIDAVVTFELYPHLDKRIKEENLSVCYENIERPLVPITAQMELTGICVDVPYLNELKGYLEERIPLFQYELDNRVLQFGAMPVVSKALTVKEKKMLGFDPKEKSFQEVELPSFNVSSSKQAVHVLNAIGFSVLKSSKAAIETPNYSEQTLKLAQKSLNSTKTPGMLSEEGRKLRHIANLQYQMAVITGKLAPLDPNGARIDYTTEETLQKAYEIRDLILDLRAARMGLNTFCIPLSSVSDPLEVSEDDELEDEEEESPKEKKRKKYINPVTGRIHMNLNQLETDTGRESCSKPNLQNQPNGSKSKVFGGRTFRRAFVPSPGMLMGVADYGACEIRILAEMSKDKGVIFACSGNDPHVGNAAVMFGVALEDVTEEMRAAAKQGFFAKVYGAGANKLAAVLKIPKGQAQELMKTLESRFLGVQSYIRAMQTMAESKGYVLSLSGRKRYFDVPPAPRYSDFPNGEGYADAMREHQWAMGSIGRKAQNAPIQATNADITKLAKVLVAPRLKKLGAYLLLSVHDELVIEAPADKIDEALKVLCDTMLEAEQEFFQVVKTAVSGKKGDHWVK